MWMQMVLYLEIPLQGKEQLQQFEKRTVILVNQPLQGSKAYKRKYLI